MKTLIALFLTIMIVGVILLAHANPPTCSTSVTENGIELAAWQGTVWQTYKDSGGYQHVEYLHNTTTDVMQLHNPCDLTVSVIGCDTSTSNRVLKVLVVCPPSTNAVVSWLYMPPGCDVISWTFSQTCNPCQATFAPHAVSTCGSE